MAGSAYVPRVLREVPVAVFHLVRCLPSPSAGPPWSRSQERRKRLGCAMRRCGLCSACASHRHPSVPERCCMITPPKRRAQLQPGPRAISDRLLLPLSISTELLPFSPSLWTSAALPPTAALPVLCRPLRFHAKPSTGLFYLRPFCSSLLVS